MTSVGYELYREVRDLAPGDWTPAERVTALMIADAARVKTRIALIPNALLCQRTGLSPTGLRGALQRLEKRGYEFRIAKGKGRDGRKVYAVNSHETEYCVPFLHRPSGDTRASPDPVDKPP